MLQSYGLPFCGPPPDGWGKGELETQSQEVNV